MSEYIDQPTAEEVRYNGTLLGGTEPSMETKYSYWKVYYYGDKIFALAMYDSDPVNGEIISDADLQLYVDDLGKALRILGEQRKIRDFMGGT